MPAIVREEAITKQSILALAWLVILGSPTGYVQAQCITCRVSMSHPPLACTQVNTGACFCGYMLPIPPYICYTCGICTSGGCQVGCDAQSQGVSRKPQFKAASPEDISRFPWLAHTGLEKELTPYSPTLAQLTGKLQTSLLSRGICNYLSGAYSPDEKAEDAFYWKLDILSDGMNLSTFNQSEGPDAATATKGVPMESLSLYKDHWVLRRDGSEIGTGNIPPYQPALNEGGPESGPSPR